MLDNENLSRIYKFATSERWKNKLYPWITDYYKRKIEPRFKEKEVWEKWHEFTDEKSNEVFFCPFAFVEHCYLNGHPEEAISKFRELAVKPWERKFVDMLKIYGEIRETDYLMKKELL